MKAVVFHGVGDLRLDTVKDPSLREPNDAIVRLTATAICGTDLHCVRGTMPGMVAGTVLGHEGIGVVEEVGKNVRNFKAGERVVIPSTIGCGYCSYCRCGYYAQCDNANPNGSSAGTAFYGGPKSTGPFDGLQAEYARIPYANVGLVRLPSPVTDEQAIMLSDIFPTGYFGAHLAEIKPGDTVAVLGCGPVGIFSIISAGLFNAGRIIAIDCIPTRLEMARSHGAEIVNFHTEDPVQAIKELTGGIGVDRLIDAVGVDAVEPGRGPAKASRAERKSFKNEVESIVEKQNPDGKNWIPGNAPSQAVRWAVDMLAKGGTLSIIGVYPPNDDVFPIGKAMNKNLTINMGNCNHRRYIPHLVGLVRSGAVDPSAVLTQDQPIMSAIEAYESFDQRESGWVKVALQP